MDTVAPKRLAGSRGTILGFAVLAVGLFGLAGRLLSYPLNRDENMFVSVASQLGSGDLYRDLGYNHLPNLAYLLAGLFAITGNDYFLLVGRLVILVSWVVAVWALWILVRRLQLGVEVFFASAALLLGNVLLLGPSGMLVSNNFLPIPLLFLAFYFLIGALDRENLRKRDAFLAGLIVSFTIGLKANYIILAPAFALATLLAPATRPVTDRFTQAFLPLALGGIIGGLPALAHLAIDPEGFLAHTLHYFTELQPAYWAATDEPKVVGISSKIRLAEQIWFAHATLLAIAAIAVLGCRQIARSGLRSLFDWRLVLLALLLGCGLVVAFVPSPSFQQYFVPPIPLLILLVIVFASHAKVDREHVVIPLMLAVALLASLVGASRILPGLPEFRDPGSWQTIALKREVSDVGDRAGLAPGTQIATMTPVFALEGGYSIYPEFAAGQFVYRVAPYMTDEERAFYKTTAPAELESFFDANPPDAIMVNKAEPLERDFARYAISRGYVAHENTDVAQGFELFVIPK